MNISVQSIITQHFLKNRLNDIGIVKRSTSLSGHLIKKAVLAALRYGGNFLKQLTYAHQTYELYPHQTN